MLDFLKKASLLIALLMTQGCATSIPQETLRFPQPEMQMTLPCKNPSEIPKKGSSYSALEVWAVEVMQIWSECARDKKALVNSWPKN